MAHQKPIHPLVRSYLLRRPGWSEHHVEIAVGMLNRWTRWLTRRHVDILDATGDDCAEYLAERMAAVSGATAHKDYQHLIWFYTWLVAEGEIDTRRDRGPMHNIKPPAVSDPDPERTGHISAADYHRLMGSFGRRAVLDCRNAAICSLMYWSGLRRSEVVRCDLDRLDLDAGTIEFVGKNGKWRKVPLVTETVLLLERYLRRRADDGAVALFAVGAQGVHAATTGRMRADAISSMLERRCRQLGISVTAHQFRRASSINGKDRGLSDTTVCNVHGWADNRMLIRYQRAEATRLATEEFQAADPTAQRARRRRSA